MLTFKQGMRMLTLSERANFYRELLRRREWYEVDELFIENSSFDSFKKFISSAFVWDNSTLGHDYWYEVSVKNIYQQQ